MRQQKRDEAVNANERISERKGASVTTSLRSDGTWPARDWCEEVTERRPRDITRRRNEGRAELNVFTEPQGLGSVCTSVRSASPEQSVKSPRASVRCGKIIKLAPVNRAHQHGASVRNEDMARRR